MFGTLRERLLEPRRFIQVLAGPRQTGKTTLSLQVAADLNRPVHRASADGPNPRDPLWIRQQWEIGRLHAREALAAGGAGATAGAVLILDEIQKIEDWSDTVKQLWDEDSATNLPLHVVVLGSAPWHVRSGLSDSLAGRFEIIAVPHWSFPEMRAAFGWTLEQFVYFGGYPGSAGLISDVERWKRYISESLIETTISRDVLLMARIGKPALLRQFFDLACAYSSQVLSYTKMLGQLHDAGNTTTLAHYLDLLAAAGMVTGLPKFSRHEVRQRASSPKLQVMNTALISARSPVSFAGAQQDRHLWGRLVESAVGAHLLSSLTSTGVSVTYWRERNKGVDFVLSDGDRVVGVEVKSGARRSELPGLAVFGDRFNPVRPLLVGSGGLDLAAFLSTPAIEWLR